MKSKPKKRIVRAKKSVTRQSALPPEPIGDQLDYVYKILHKQLTDLTTMLSHATSQLRSIGSTKVGSLAERDKWISAIEVYEDSSEAKESSGTYVAQAIRVAMENDSPEELNDDDL